MKPGLWLALIFTLAFLLIPSVQAAAYYMAPNGNNGWDCLYETYQTGTTHGPCATLTRFNYHPDWNPTGINMKAGYTLYVRGGTYEFSGDTIRTWNSGTEGAPITVKNYPGETPIFRSTGVDYYNETYVIYQQADYWIWEGLEFRPLTGSAYALFYVTGNHNIFRNFRNSEEYYCSKRLGTS